MEARADWSITNIELTVLGNAEGTRMYRVTGFVAHKHDGDVSAKQRMQSGHYIAYVHNLGVCV